MKPIKNEVLNYVNDDDNDIIVEVDQVTFRGDRENLSGSIVVRNQSVQWRNIRDKVVITLKFTEIRLQRQSPDTKEKVQLQIVPFVGDAQTFTFIGQNRDDQKKRRETAKIAIQSGLNKTKNTALAKEQAKKSEENQLTEQRELHDKQCAQNADLEQKQKLLQENKMLATLYEELVLSRIITAQDFWTNYANDKLATAKKSSKPSPIDAPTDQSIGISADFLASIRQIDGCNSIRLNITSDTMKAIFRTYPAVEKRHLALVPQEMSETEFWTAFFKSHYFHRDRLFPAGHTSTDPFAQCRQFDEQEMRRLRNATNHREHIDLDAIREPISDWATDEVSFPTASTSMSTLTVTKMDASGQESKSAKNQALVHQFNYHSSRILQATIPSAPAAKGLPTTSSRLKSPPRNGELKSMPKKRQRHLNSNIDDEAVVLMRKRSLSDDHYAHYSVQLNEKFSALPSTADLDELPQQDATRLCSDVFSALSRPRLEIINDDKAMSQLLSYTQNLSQGTFLENLNSSIIEQVQELHVSLFELLRHFWRCFPVNSEETKQKLDRMNFAISTFKQQRLINLEERCDPNMKRAIAYLKQCCDAALQRYHHWNSRRKKAEK